MRPQLLFLIGEIQEYHGASKSHWSAKTNLSSRTEQQRLAARSLEHPNCKMADQAGKDREEEITDPAVDANTNAALAGWINWIEK